jgi:hypothetical protein
MWYRVVKAQIGGGAIQNDSISNNEVPQSEIPTELRPELIKILSDLGISPDQYCNLPEESQKYIWDILVYKNDTNLYNEMEDSDTPGFDATEARRHSPYHQNPSFTTLEEQLEATRHDTVDNVPNNMQQAEKGNGGMALLNGNGAPQYASGKGGRLFYDNLPSDRTLV